MSDNLQIMFRENGRATTYQLRRWREKGALQALQPAAQYVRGGYATRAYRSLWRIAFPDREPLPTDAVATRDGRFTSDMLSIWL